MMVLLLVLVSLLTWVGSALVRRRLGEIARFLFATPLCLVIGLIALVGNIDYPVVIAVAVYLVTVVDSLYVEFTGSKERDAGDGA